MESFFLCFSFFFAIDAFLYSWFDSFPGSQSCGSGILESWDPAFEKVLIGLWMQTKMYSKHQTPIDQSWITEVRIIRAGPPPLLSLSGESVAPSWQTLLTFSSFAEGTSIKKKWEQNFKIGIKTSKLRTILLKMGKTFKIGNKTSK